MLVIIPHSTEVLKLTKFQKNLIRENFSKNILITRILPLWIELPFITEKTNDEKELKQTAGKINSVIIEKPEYKAETSQLCCPVQINYCSQLFSVDFPILNIKNNNHNDFCLKNKSTEEICFPLCLKIFRLGIKDSNPQEHSFSIKNSVWKKI